MDNKNQKLLRILLILLILILLNICLIKYTPFVKQIFIMVLPVLFGFTYAFILYPFVKILSKKVSKKMAVLIVFMIFIIIMVGILVGLIPVVIKELINFFEHIPEIIDGLGSIKNSKFLKTIEYIKSYVDLEKFISSKIIALEEVGIQFLKSFFSIILIFVLSIIISAYILNDFDNIISWLKSKTSDVKYTNIRICLVRMKELMYSYFGGVFLVLIFMFAASSFCFKLIGLNYYVVMGILFAICNLVPYVGPYIGGAFAVISGFLISYKIAILALIIVVVLQLFENYILTPRIQSKKLKIKPFYLLLTVIVMGKLFGIIGMLISIPILSLFQTIIDIFILKKEADFI